MPRGKNTFKLSTPRSPVPVPTSQLPPPKLWHQSQPTGFFASLQEGFAFGTGAELARTAVRGVLGSAAVATQKSEFEQCLEKNVHTLEECKEMYTKK
jgi:hypothetical protein